MEPGSRWRAAAEWRALHPAHRHSLDEGICDLDHGPLSPTEEREEMTTIYAARWVLPVSSLPIDHGAVAIDGPFISGVGARADIVSRFPEARVESFGESVILPGFVT